jgi:hypothetical protein
MVAWQTRTGQSVIFDIRINMSDHCYTEGIDQQKRIFDPIRYRHSIHIPAVIGKLCDKPSTTIKLVERKNYAVFQLSLPSELMENEQYWIFFHFKRSKIIRLTSHLAVTMYIESAYPRASPVITKQHLPFGSALENLFP